MHNYDHYIALEWAKINMAIARMTKHMDSINVIDVPSDIKELKLYLGQLRGKKILTFEETDTSQWLYIELRNFVDEIIVCDPYRNKLLSEGPKDDKKDASKLVRLLKNNLLKPVYHSGELFFSLRKFVSGYEDLIKSGVRLQNQKKSLLKAVGINDKTGELTGYYEQFVLQGIERGIEYYNNEKSRYEKEFAKICKENRIVGNLESIPGIGDIGAVKLAAIIINANRFKDKGAWYSYCGLVELEKMSGRKSYGHKKPRYSRTAKSVLKTAAFSVIYGKTSNYFRDYYDYLMKEKNYAEYNARHAVARKLAAVALGVFRTGKKYKERKLADELVQAKKIIGL